MSSKSTTLSKRRFYTIYFIVSVLFCVVIYQAVQLTIYRRDSLLSVADRQHLLRMNIAPMRGSILDRNGKEFATNLKVPSIYAVPRAMSAQGKKEVSKSLANVLDLSSEYLDDRLQRDKAFIWIKRRVNYEEAEKVHALNFKGIGIIEEAKRFYPQGDLLAQVIGFTNIDAEGIEGIELRFNKELKGSPGYRKTKRDALGRELRAKDDKVVPAVNGHDVILTIDQHIQYLTERALEEAYSKWKAKGAAAIVMDPKTGEVLAMSSRPNFNPNSVGESKVGHRRNRTVTDMYEPGSVFKIVAASAALNEKAATRETNFFCENGEYRYGSRTLHDVHAYGDLTFDEVIIKSSNIGTVKIAALLDHEKYYQYIRKFGFGGRTGIDLHGEAPGFVRSPQNWSKTTPYNLPMGHEIMVTALQVASAMSVIANDGKRMQPFVVSEIKDQVGVTLKKFGPRVVESVLEPNVARDMREILTKVVEEGTGKRAAIEGVKVGGKTGTAQKVLENGKGYSHEDYISSFVGFAPAEDPQFVMVVMLDDPGPKYYGGTVAAPVFKQVIEAALLYRGHVPENATVIDSSR